MKCWPHYTTGKKKRHKRSGKQSKVFQSDFCDKLSFFTWSHQFVEKKKENIQLWRYVRYFMKWLNSCVQLNVPPKFYHHQNHPLPLLDDEAIGIQGHFWEICKYVQSMASPLVVESIWHKGVENSRQNDLKSERVDFQSLCRNYLAKFKKWHYGIEVSHP